MINHKAILEELRKKWIQKLEQHQTTWYTKNDEELLLLLKQPVNPFTKDELESISNPKGTEEDFKIWNIAIEKAKKLRNEL
jgi:hypothetical protein